MAIGIAVGTMSAQLKIAETYLTVQGEGSHAGLPCFFIRTAGCDLRCTWCDTPNALTTAGSRTLPIQEILELVPPETDLIQITGGEPMLQRAGIVELSNRLMEARPGRRILLETGGHISLEGLPEGLHIVMDVKLPDSGEADRDFSRNFAFLKRTDEIKFVVGGRADFDIAVDWINEYNLTGVCELLFSPVWGAADPRDLAGWLLESGLRARMQVQLHKIIWGADATGV